MTGKVFIGCTPTVSEEPNWFIRVMHASLGLPLISMLQEPHLPALQFQRTARSGASFAWIRCRTSRTTMPGLTSTRYSTNEPPAAVPRQTRNRRSDTTRLQILDLGAGNGRQLLRRLRPPLDPGLHPSVSPLAHDDLHVLPLLALSRVIH